MNVPKKIFIKEVGPRDGLQNEETALSTADKITWIDMLSQTGLSYIEITSFVHPKWIPALSDALDVAKGINRKPGVTYAALFRTEKGWNGLSKEGSMKLLFSCRQARHTTGKILTNRSEKRFQSCRKSPGQQNKQASPLEPTCPPYLAVLMNIMCH